MSSCADACRAALAHAICNALEAHVPQRPNISQDSRHQRDQRGTAVFLSKAQSAVLLAQRAGSLFVEFGCADVSPPLQAKGVLDGKSGSSFLVGGGRDVNPNDSRTYSVILKQVSNQESALLDLLHMSLVEHYQRSTGSLLAQAVGRVRYVPQTGSSFEAVLMDNVARAPPVSSANLPSIRPFDLKGIRLYTHEKRFRSLFGERGLRIGAQRLKVLREALQSDIALLTSWNIIDYSYLLSVYPTASPPKPCAEVARHADYAFHPRKTSRSTLLGASLLSAFVVLPTETPTSPTQPFDWLSHATSSPNSENNRSDFSQVSVAVNELCVPVLVRARRCRDAVLHAHSDSFDYARRLGLCMRSSERT